MEIIIIVAVVGVWVTLCKILWDEKSKKIKAEKEIQQKYLASDYYKSTGLPMDKVFSDKGLYGEYCLELICENIPLKHRMLFNLIIPQRNGHFQEIDALCILENGDLILLEGKNRPGVFSGLENNYITDKQWLQKLGQNEHEMYNPILQSKYHGLAFLKWLCEQGCFDRFKGFKQMYNMIIFVDNDVTFDFDYNQFAEVETSGIFAGNANAAIEYFNYLADYDNGNPDFVDQLYEYLYPLTQNDNVEEMMRAREENSKLKYKNRFGKSKYFRLDCFPAAVFRYDGEYVECATTDRGIWTLFYDFEKFSIDKLNKTWFAVPNMNSKISYLEGHDLTAHEMSPDEVCEFFVGD